MNNNPTAVGQTAQMPRETEKKEGSIAMVSRIYPTVYGGTCEKCGTLDPNIEAIHQYKLCEHYRGMNLECSYCDPSKDSNEVTRISKLHIYDHPFKKDSYGRPVLGVVCDAFNCMQKFNAEYGR